MALVYEKKLHSGDYTRLAGALELIRILAVAGKVIYLFCPANLIEQSIGVLLDQHNRLPFTLNQQGDLLWTASGVYFKKTRNRQGVLSFGSTPQS